MNRRVDRGRRASLVEVAKHLRDGGFVHRPAIAGPNMHASRARAFDPGQTNARVIRGRGRGGSVRRAAASRTRPNDPRMAFH